MRSCFTIVGGLAAIAGLTVALACGPASSAVVTPETACVAAAPVGSADPALDEKYLAAARSAEAFLGVAESGSEKIATARLSVADPAGAGPSPVARAAYCSASGELARRGQYGNPLDATGYLTVAFISAEQARAAEPAARAAYRLGMSLTVSPIGVMGRGALRRDGPDPVEDMQTTLLDPRRGTEACDAMLGLQTRGAPAQPTATLAFSCSAQKASEDRDSDLASLADLRLARLLLDAIERFPDQGARLRKGAADIVLARLARAEDGVSPEVTARLIETALDAGVGQDPTLAAATSRLQLAAGNDPDVGAHAAALQGRLLLALGRQMEARDELERAIFLENQRPTPGRLPDWYMLMAAADPSRRAIHVEAAYRALDDIRSLLPVRDPLTEESTYALHMRAVFQAAVDDALSRLPVTGAARPAPPSAALEAEIDAAQGIIEKYREAELQNAFGNECVAEAEPVKPRALRSDEVILYPVVLEDRLEILYLRGGGSGIYRRLAPRTDFDRARVVATVAAMRRAIVAAVLPRSATRGSTDWRTPSRTLYDLLIKPIEPQLGPDSTLVVVPDITLSALPFSALADDKGRFLIEKARLDIAPGLAYTQPGASHAGKRAFIVAGSLDKDVRLPFGVFEKLDNAAAEARYAAGDAGSGRSKNGVYIADFTRASLVKALQVNRADVLHLATHASFNGSSDKSFIVANGGFISLTDLRQIIGANHERGRELDLLVLSACETAVGDDEANLGLAGAAVQSGARGAIATLWPVNDASTALLMRGFYDRYRAGAGKAEAIQGSQLALVRRPEFREPYYWASMILVGGWR